MARPICRFWQQGNCKYGDNCRFEHPGSRGGGGRDGGYDSDRGRNRSGALQQGGRRDGNGHGNGPFGGSGGGRGHDPHSHPYGLSKDAIIKDLTTERPMWIFSAYGPGQKAPIQLMGGPQREQSFEEMRLRHYIAAAQGNPQQAIQEAQTMYQEAEAQIKNVLNDVDGAIRYVVNGENVHPNRFDIIKQMQQPGGFQPVPVQPSAFNKPAPGFGQPAIAPTATFGQPNVLQPPDANPFATKPGFVGTTNFGQPSVVAAQPAFGQPAQPGAFRSAVVSAPPPAFAQPNPLAPKDANPFAQAAQAGAFAQPVQPTFGQATQPQPAFGQPTQPVQPTFDHPTQPTQPAFGQPTQPGQQPQPAFGQPVQTANFGQPSQPGQQPQPSAAFGNPSQPAQPNPFSQPSATPTGFGQTPISAPQAHSPTSQAPFVPVGETRRDASGRLTLWHGRPVEYVRERIEQTLILDPVTGRGVPDTSKAPETYPCYKRPDGTLEKIHFPNGKKEGRYEVNSGAQVDDGLYTEDVKAQYEYMAREGKFRDGVMPSIPPRKEWINWDF